MEYELQQLVKEYSELLDTQKFREEDLDYSVLDKHIASLEVLNVVESSSISVFDLYKKKHIYLSSGFELQLGWDNKQAHSEGNEYINTKIHPADFLELLKAGNYFMKLAFTGISKQDWKSYKLINDYRVLNSKREYVRVIEQHLCLEQDKRGNYWLDLSIMDLNPDQEINAPFRCRLLNYKTGELFRFPPELPASQELVALSVREKEILKLVAQGLVSKQIADRLFISVNTVNTHRQRIIEKLNVTNTAEAIKYASSVGWL